MTEADLRVQVVIATRNRAQGLLATLERLQGLPERPGVIVVDNGSDDGTPDRVRRRFPKVEVVSLDRNLGAAARTVGARRASAPYVALTDDDSWWEAGALGHAADLLDGHPPVGLLAARIVVGDGRVDPTCEEMSRSPLRARAPLPGKPVLGFVGCGAVARRSAFLEVGGYHPRFLIGAEEELLAIDLASAGWELVYVDDVVAHHRASDRRDPAHRRRITLRNSLWAAWLRRPPAAAVRRSVRLVAASAGDRPALRGAGDALAGLGWVARERRVVPGHVERALRTLGH